jgi:hypothetical protein
VPGGDVLIAGGSDGYHALSSAEVFDPAVDAFTALPGSMTARRNGAVAAPLPDGDVLIAGGGRKAGSSAEVFDSSTGIFTALSRSMTTPRTGAVAAPLRSGNVLIAGGSDRPSAEMFNPATERFTALPESMTIVRNGAAAALLPNGDVLIAGGYDGYSFRASAEVFEPAQAYSGGAGQIRLLTCKPVTTRSSTRHCTTQLLIVGAKFTTNERAVITYVNVVYATGSTRNGQLIMRTIRRLTPGTYILGLKHLTNKHWITTRYEIVIHATIKLRS